MLEFLHPIFLQKKNVSITNSRALQDAPVKFPMKFMLLQAFCICTKLEEQLGHLFGEVTKIWATQIELSIGILDFSTNIESILQSNLGIGMESKALRN